MPSSILRAQTRCRPVHAHGLTAGQKTVENLDRAAGPLCRRAIADRRPRAAGSLGRWAAGPLCGPVFSKTPSCRERGQECLLYEVSQKSVNPQQIVLTIVQIHSSKDQLMFWSHNVFIHGFTALHSTSFSRLSTCIVLQLLQGNTKEKRESHVSLQILSQGTHGVPLQVKSVLFLT